MRKAKMDTEEVLNVIREGMDDSAIMKKYNMSSGELRRLLTKITDAGILRYLSAKDVLRDIASGLSETELREKYKLSSAGFMSLLEQLDKEGLLNRGKQRGVGPEMISLLAGKIVDDIRSGLARVELIQKYGLSFRGLQWVCLMLVRKGAMSSDEISERMCSNYEELVPRKVRAFQRFVPDSEVSIFELGHPEIQGRVSDISEKGVRVVGIAVTVGEIKTLTVREDEFGEFDSLTFDAICRWVRKGADGEYVAGFEITHISTGSLAELRVLIQSVVSNSQRLTAQAQ